MKYQHLCIFGEKCDSNHQNIKFGGAVIWGIYLNLDLYGQTFRKIFPIHRDTNCPFTTNSVQKYN